MDEFQSKVIESIAVLQTEMRHIRERLDLFISRQDTHENRLDKLEKAFGSHDGRLVMIEGRQADFAKDLEPVRAGRAFTNVVKWGLGLVVLVGSAIGFVVKFGLIG